MSKQKMRQNKLIYGIVFFILAIFILSGCNNATGGVCIQDVKLCPDGSSVGRSGPICAFAPCPASKGDAPKDTKLAEFQSTQQLKKFSSAKEIAEFLRNAQASSGQSPMFYGRSGNLGDMQIENAAAPQPLSKSLDSSSSTSTTDYSKTNVQVEGVDEADFVKNDGKYIYTLSQNKLIIVDAYPADSAKALSETKIEGSPRNMFISKDRLAVFSDDNAQVPVYAEYDFMPRPRYVAKTHVFVYDISDRERPKLVKDYNINGYYFNSRMIDNYVYFIAKDNVYFYNKVVDLPVIMQASKAIMKPEVYYFDNPENNYVFHTVASFDIFGNDDKINAKTFMMGYSNNLYVSKSNIYITYQKNLPYTYYGAHNEERFYSVVVPLLSSEIQAKINRIKDDSSLSSYDKWDKISDVLEEMYNKMEKNEKEKLIDNVGGAIEDYEARLEQERRKSVIHKISIGNGKIDYDSRGEVPGYLLNQFSMDEDNGYLRVATTTEFYGRSPIPLMGEPSIFVQSESKQTNSMPIRQSSYVMYNNVYVLDGKMKVAGKIEEIAPDERIYSTRFIGDRLYMVTFKRVDPLFVIDLSSPQKPQILGKLKIPGFSDYLHPYDENHIMGIGKETGSNEWGGISTKGLKLALFDVSDVKNPKEVDKYEIGESGTDSEALREHKAFLFDKKKNILVIPVTEVKGKQYYDSSLGYYRQRFWQGAYVFGITPEDGFKVKGKITHNEGDEGQNYYYYGSPNAVRRSLYMGDVLYTVSGIKIKANDISNIDKEIKEIKLPYEKVNYYDYPYVNAGSASIVPQAAVK